jgi:uncharacterized protein YjbJ (UPF0337 family)
MPPPLSHFTLRQFEPLGGGDGQNRIAGVVQQAKGVVKSAVGRVIGSAKLQAKGKADQAAGKVKDAMSRPKQKTP